MRKFSIGVFMKIILYFLIKWNCHPFHIEVHKLIFWNWVETTSYNAKLPKNFQATILQATILKERS